MPIDKVFYSKTFPVGVYWEKMGAEMTLTENQNPKEAIGELKKLVEETHFELNKELYEMRGTKTVNIGHPDYVKKPMDAIVKSWYDKAVKEGDTKTIEELEKEFIVE